MRKHRRFRKRVLVPMEEQEERRHSNDTILLKLGELVGLNKTVLTRIDAMENNHANEMRNMHGRVDALEENNTARLNDHGKRIKELEQYKAAHIGEENGKRMITGLVVSLVLMCGAAFAWLFSNGWAVVEASKKASGVD